jgi:hypothetical protein
MLYWNKMSITKEQDLANAIQDLVCKLTNEIELLKEELFYWKKYKHLEFEKLEEDEDYWDSVVGEHDLRNWDCDKDKYVYPEGKKEYDNFCKYFPRPKYDDTDEDDE